MLTKFAKADVMEVRSASAKQRSASLSKFSEYNDYRTDDDFVYVRVRAISSRVNKNHDGWPSDELAKSYRSFVGKPIFVDHHNSDPKKARGVIVDAALHVEDEQKAARLDPYYASAPDNHRPPTWVELLLEVDAKKYPKLAKAVISGDIDGVSMGANVEKSKCSHCGNVARTPEEYCKHVVSKGAHHDYRDPKTGFKTSKRSYEDCYDIGFFEISFVFDPADETALVRDIRQSKVAAAVYEEAGESMDAPEQAQDAAQELGNEMVISARREYRQALHEGGDRDAGIRAALATLKNMGANKDQAVAAVSSALATPAEYVAAAGPPSPTERVWWNDPANPQGYSIGTVVDDFMSRRSGGIVTVVDENTGERKTMRSSEVTSLKGVPLPEGREAKTADRRNDLPQGEMTTAPDKVDTLRQEQLCPICGSDMEDGVCEVCNYEEPPEGFDNPDLDKAQEVDQQMQQQREEQGADPNAPVAAPLEAESGDGTGGGAGVPGQPQVVSSVNGYIYVGTDGKYAITPVVNTTSTSSSATVSSDMTNTVHTANANTKGSGPSTSGGLVNPGERAALPPSSAPSDRPTGARVVQDYNKPVESSMSTQKQITKEADGPAANGGADVKPDRRVNVEGTGGVMEVDSADATVDVAGRGGVATGDPEKDAEHQDVTKEVNVTAPSTDTWSGDKGQTNPIQGDNFPSNKKSHEEKAAREILNEDHAKRINVETPLTEEGKVGPGTDQWTGLKRQADPVTTETFPKNSAAEVRARVFAALKLAEEEVALGLTNEDEKFERAAELENETPEALAARSETVARIKHAGLRKNASQKKSSVNRTLPSMQRVASQRQVISAIGDEQIGDSALFGGR